LMVNEAYIFHIFQPDAIVLTSPLYLTYYSISIQWWNPHIYWSYFPWSISFKTPVSNDYISLIKMDIHSQTIHNLVFHGFPIVSHVFHQLVVNEP
jgi:hypothetical protein